MPTSRRFETGPRDGSHRRRRRAPARAATLAGSLSLVVGLLGTAGAATSASSASSAAPSHARLAVSSVSTKTFTTQGCSTWTPPAAGQYEVVALGSAGQSGSGSNTATGGYGDQVSADFAVTGSAATFEVCVDSGGGAGGAGDGETQTPGGNGGGASSLFVKTSSGYVPVVVAGGGGGTGGQGATSGVGGNGGAAGENGADGTGSSHGFGGSAGTGSAGGSGGSYGNYGDSGNYTSPGEPGGGFSAASGAPGAGGAGSADNQYGGGGGGGGGGYYGGGGGSGSFYESTGGGGGGGSDYCASGIGGAIAVSDCATTQGAGTSYGALADGGSAEVELVPVASQLIFTTEPPSSIDVRTPFAVTVAAETTGGAVVSTYRVPVTLSIASGPSSGKLSCPTTTDTVTPQDGVATFHCGIDAAGAYTLEATSSGLRSATSSSVTVTKGVTHTAVTLSPTSTTDGTPVTYSAKVSGSLGTVTGSVTFSVNGSTLCTGQITNIEGSASCTSAAAPVGTDTVTGTYSGSGQYLVSSGTARLVVSAVSPPLPPPPPPPPAPVTPAPALSGIAPASGPASGGTSVTLSGTDLCAPSSVSFGSASATVVSVNAACTQVVVLDPSGTPSSTVPVRLVNAGGTSNAESFTYAPVVLKAVASPVVTSLSPIRGLTSGGEDVTIDGANLCGVSAVDFGTAQATLVATNAACTEVTVADPPGSGQVAVTLTTPVGTAAAPERFGYVAPGYRLVGADGGVFDFGHSAYGGSLPGLGISVDDIVGMARDPGAGGYWLVGKDGGVFAFGGAPFLGSLPGLGISVHDITGIVATPGGGGYWLVGADGGVFAFGDAPFLGSIPGLGISVHDITGIVADPRGQGYWLVGKDGGVFAFGDAPFLGSIPGLGISVHDITGIVVVPGGQGYWLVGKDGGIFSFGDAPYLGSLPGQGVHVDDITGIETTS